MEHAPANASTTTVVSGRPPRPAGLARSGSPGTSVRPRPTEADAAAPAALALALTALFTLSPPAAGQQGEPAGDTARAPSDSLPAAGFGACPVELTGPAPTGGIAWGDTTAALRALGDELDADPPSAAGAGRLLEQGDRAVAAGRHTMAYAAYGAAVRDGGGYEALWKAARAAVDMGQDAGEDAAEEWYVRAEGLARRAVEAEPGAAEGHLQLAQALGLVALDAGVRERVRMSEEIRAEARAAIEADSSYAGGWHVLGRWNKGVMELSGAGRFFARTFLGGQVLGEASWEKAARYLERASELEPGRIVHHLELARVYRHEDRAEAAREKLRTVLELPPRDYHDCVYREEARQLLSETDGG